MTPRTKGKDAAGVRVLAIESSCDETGIAVLDALEGLLAHRVHSQVELHQRYGGVVPELASREHVARLLPLLRETLAAAGVGPETIDGVAYTAGPGLIGALLTGAAFARALAYGWGVPAVGVHHLEGHLLAPFLEPDPPPLPHLALLVSGGHTMLIDVERVGRYRILGETRDDAAGEAFDKSAKLLGLPYPGGPQLAALAAQGRAGRFGLPRPMLDRAGYEFSFSGLKTAVALAARDRVGDEAARADLALAVQDAIVDTLVGKTLRALQDTGRDALVVAGGVGANLVLRARLREGAERLGVRVYHPRLEFCTDNAAMIAVAGLVRLGEAPARPVIEARAQWPLASLGEADPARGLELQRLAGRRTAA